MDEIWTTRDGTRIAVGDMTEGHVRNALRMILRNQRIQEEMSAQLFDTPLNQADEDAILGNVWYDEWGSDG